MLKLQFLPGALQNIVGFLQWGRSYAPLHQQGAGCFSSHHPNTHWDKKEHPGVRRSLRITPLLEVK